jgi:mRNA interferase HigB
MHIISRRTLIQFWLRHPDSEKALRAWFHEVKGERWHSSAAIKRKYPTASIVGAERVVFNICGNRYRLVARINYQSETVFVRFVGTHEEYDTIDVRSV